MNSVREMRTRVRLNGRRGRWAWRATVFGGVAALVACSTADGTRAFAAGPSVAGQRLPQPSRVQRQASQESLNPQKVLEETQRKAKETIEGVANAPTAFQQKARAAVDNTIDTLTNDDGKVLNANSPAGAIGAIAVSAAVLPYIPVSIYSSYLVATTGTGIEPGPNGLFGIAEGIATLVVFAVCAWSLTSFITRARGLPEGPFSSLGATQALSFVAALLFGGATFLSGGDNLNPFSEKTQTPGKPEATKQIEKELDRIAKEPSDIFSGFTKAFDSQIDQAKKQVESQLDSVKSQVASKASEATATASAAASKATAAATTKAAEVAKAAQEKAANVADKAKESVATTAGKISSKVSLPDYGDLLEED